MRRESGALAGQGHRAGGGFTLLELLVAIAVFAVVALLAYGGLASVLEAREQTAAGADRLRALQQTMQMVQRDVDQVVQRGIRDDFGDSKPALHGGHDWIEFTRSGWSNPAEQPRSTLQRVAYAVREGSLVRAHWQVLDRAQDSVPYEAPLLPEVRALRVFYLDDNGEWQEIWPPLSQLDSTVQPTPLPRALRLELELERWGTLTRLLRVR